MRFFPVLRVDFTIVGDLPRILAQMRSTLRGPVGSSGFPAPIKRRAKEMAPVTGCQVYTHEPHNAHKKIKPPRNVRGGRS
ncbi:hypothetical protein M3I53_07845 [Paraburkholderia sp. CNPSo 3272]|uniref:hypothetical protein n=1 Tax=Paraburkholderia sp. CNPSo 3272 TaxID=2940931 RepID=UPI0020B74691|nr:hypothetical protein [Paraburkholderia sp. CNPSo 3272]MCP3723044.1 hypothetical protein [Paraburkholderia sp. CNPSo 3272]